MTNANGTQNIGFVSGNTFTTNVTFDSETTFTVKSSYSIFKANQSSGVSVSVAANSSTPLPDINPSTSTTTTTQPLQLSVTYVGDKKCSTLDEYKSLGTSGKDKIKVEANGKNVTNEATITTICYFNGEEIPCNTMENGKNYEIDFVVLYKNQKRLVQVKIGRIC
jgi:hypothetical protein